MTELEQIAKQFVREHELTLGETLALSLFVARAKLLLQPQAPATNVTQMGAIDHERGWRLTEEG